MPACEKFPELDVHSRTTKPWYNCFFCRTPNCEEVDNATYRLVTDDASVNHHVHRQKIYIKTVIYLAPAHSCKVSKKKVTKIARPDPDGSIFCSKHCQQFFQEVTPHAEQHTYIFIPLQLGDDSNIQLHSRFVNGMKIAMLKC